MKDKDTKLLEEAYDKLNKPLQYKDHWVGSIIFPKHDLKGFKVLASSYRTNDGLSYNYKTIINSKEIIGNSVEELENKLEDILGLEDHYYETQ